MKLREPCELRRDGMKSELARKKSNGLEKKSTSGEKFFLLSTYFSIFLWLFDLRARALRSLKSGNYYYFGFILVYYYLTIIVIFNQISFKKWIKLVKSQTKIHKMYQFSTKLRRYFRPVALSRCGRIFNQWLYVTCGRSVSETEFQWRNICKKCTGLR